MGTTTVITGVLAQVKELLNVHVPGFQISANRTFALAALIHGNGRVIHDFEERHNALTFAVGAFDVGTQRAHRSPIITQSACKLGQHGVVLNRPVNTE